MSTEPRPLAGGLEAIVARYRDQAQTVDGELDAERDAEHEQRIEDLRAQRWRDVCPQRFHAATLEWVTAEHPTAARELVAWSRSRPRPNLVLLGPVGTGKTSAALSLCRADWFDHGLACEFWPEVELFDALRPDGGHDVEDLADVPRLIVDDLGSAKPTEWTHERLYAVVNRRWLEERPTIVTANLGPDELAATVGERLFSRLIGDEATVVQLAGHDRRRRTPPLRSV